MTDFSFEAPPRIIGDIGGAARLGPRLTSMGCRTVFLVTDAGVVSAGLLDAVLPGLEAAGLTVFVHAGVVADPPESVVEAAVLAARRCGADTVIGFGGGSAMDTAKLVAALVPDTRPVQALYGFDQLTVPRLRLVQVPTTAGTGSEVTPIAIVTTPSDEKKGVISSALLPDLALLDADLTLGLPSSVTAATGIDAMVHAIEAYTSRHKKNPISDALALKALSLLSGAIRTAVKDGTDSTARAAMLQGACLAGLAFASAPVAAVHALAYPLGGRFHVPHGLSNALVLLPVLRFNLEAADPLYADLAEVMPNDVKSSQARGGAALIAALETLLVDMPIPRRLSEVGVTSSDLDGLADDAMQVQRLLLNNPREMGRDDALAIYRSVL